MSSTLACIGLEVEGIDELGDHLRRSPETLVGRIDGIETVQHTDSSGARVTIGRREGVVVDLVPSYASPVAGARLSGLGRFGALVQADVVDHSGEAIARFACDFEQLRHLPDPPPRGEFDAAVVALGVAMTVNADARSFAASDANLHGDGQPDEEAHRWADASFVSYGLFSIDDDAEPRAFLAGTVVASVTHVHGLTGQSFHVARVRTVGFDAIVCLATADHPIRPEPGNVVAGNCYLVVDIPALWSVEKRPRRRWLHH